MSNVTNIADIPSVFDVEEEQPINYNTNNISAAGATEEIKSEPIKNIPTESPSNFLSNLTTSNDASATEPTQQAEFMPAAISPTFMLSSMAHSSPVTENVLSSAKDRINNIRPWKDFFSLDQFRVPESSTAAQSRASHNFTHYQNNYLVILLLFTGFSL